MSKEDQQQQQLQQDLAKMRHYWEIQSRDISPTRRDWNAPYLASWMRIENWVVTLRDDLAAVRKCDCAGPENQP